MSYQKSINQIYKELKDEDMGGKIADYIPELKNVDEDAFGIALVDVDGKVYGAGDCDKSFSIQSISKVATLSMVIHEFQDKLWKRVDVEPSGNAFNSISQLEYEKGRPRNPLINAGALVITDVLSSIHVTPLEKIREYLDTLAGTACVRINQSVMDSELKHASRNTSLAYFLKAHNNFENDVDDVVKTYCGQCAIEMSCTNLARAFSYLAHGGYSKFADKEILNRSETQRMNALMLTCGFYDESGEFAFRVGMPGKSGVGGGIIAIMPGKFSVAVWSPKLNAKGNSIKGVKTLQLLKEKMNYNLF